MPTCKAGRKSNNNEGREGVGKEKGKGAKSHKNTLYKIYVREWLRTHTRRDKSMQEHKKDKVPGTQPPR